MVNFEELLKSEKWEKRLIGVKLVQIELVLQIAMTEENSDVCRTIVQILDENKKLDIVKKKFVKLIGAKSNIIYEFAIQNVSIEVLILQIPKISCYKKISEIIVQRLKENKELDVVKKSYIELMNSKNKVVREFIAENASIEIVLKMAENEVNYFISNIIIQRLNENKELDIVKKSYTILMNSKNYIVRKFVAQNAPIEIVLKMAENEYALCVCCTIVKRLEENKNLDIVKETYIKLINSQIHIIRKFVAQNVSIEIILQMAENESEDCVCEAIVQRLEKNLDILNYANYMKLINSTSDLICKFVAQNSPIEVVVQMVENDYSEDIYEVIVQRLEENRELDVVKKNYIKFINSKNYLIRYFAQQNAPIWLIVKILKDDYCYEYIGEAIGCNPNYINLTLDEKLIILVNVPKEILTELIKCERDKEVLLWILERL